MLKESPQRLTASFRDKSGFIFYKEGKLFRQINKIAKSDYEKLMTSGLYDELVKRNWLVKHEEVGLEKKHNENASVVIKPELISFISYPYEWSFGQLKDAAKLTLDIQKLALQYGVSLKDASAFNVQFEKGKPIFIDTLSFEIYKKGTPWVAYKQFCENFLAPLSLMSLTDIRLQKLLRLHIEGIPLDLTSKLLPRSTYLKKPSLLTHIHMHARMQKQYSQKFVKVESKQKSISKERQILLLDNLNSTVKSLQFGKKDTEWGKYYSETNYKKDSFSDKHELIKEFVNEIKEKPQTAWDLGANNGEFSRLLTNEDIFTISLDIDPVAVNENYQISKNGKDTKMFPFLNNLANPSPNIGWDEKERKGLFGRKECDLVLALALIHHIVLSNNVPFAMAAQTFSSFGKWLIVEFVPIEDSQVQKLVVNRQDDLSWYDQLNFEKKFSESFEIIKKEKIKESTRTLYLMKKHD